MQKLKSMMTQLILLTILLALARCSSETQDTESVTALHTPEATKNLGADFDGANVSVPEEKEETVELTPTGEFQNSGEPQKPKEDEDQETKTEKYEEREYLEEADDSSDFSEQKQIATGNDFTVESMHQTSNIYPDGIKESNQDIESDVVEDDGAEEIANSDNDEVPVKVPSSPQISPEAIPEEIPEEIPETASGGSNWNVLKLFLLVFSTICASHSVQYFLNFMPKLAATEAVADSMPLLLLFFVPLLHRVVLHKPNLSVNTNKILTIVAVCLLAVSSRMLECLHVVYGLWSGDFSVFKTEIYSFVTLIMFLLTYFTLNRPFVRALKRKDGENLVEGVNPIYTFVLFRVIAELIVAPLLGIQEFYSYLGLTPHNSSEILSSILLQAGTLMVLLNSIKSQLIGLSTEKRGIITDETKRTRQEVEKVNTMSQVISLAVFANGISTWGEKYQGDTKWVLFFIRVMSVAGLLFSVVFQAVSSFNPDLFFTRRCIGLYNKFYKLISFLLLSLIGLTCIFAALPSLYGEIEELVRSMFSRIHDVLPTRKVEEVLEGFVGK